MSMYSTVQHLPRSSPAVKPCIHCPISLTYCILTSDSTLGLAQLTKLN